MTSPLIAILLAVTFAALSLVGEAAEAETSTKIRLNTVGYLPGGEKKASFPGPGSRFAVVRVRDGVKVLEGTVTGPVLNEDTQEQLYTADFSALKRPGEYRLDVQGVGRSAPFRVAARIYDEPFRTVTRGMYLWRCGMAVTGTHNGKRFHHTACHLNDAWLDLVTGRHERRNSAGGWHDAGDYNKYVVNAGVTVGAMLRAWEEFGPQIRKVRLDMPEADGKLPNFLAEVKWELDWLFTMQAADGSVYHKVTTKNFGGMILPEAEAADRFFVGWSSSATADFVAMMAMAARHFRRYDRLYSDRCLNAARKSYAFLQAHPENKMADLEGTNTGGYQTQDSDERIWAAAELWATTGNAEVLKDLEARIRAAEARVDSYFDWGEVRNLGLFTYLHSKRSGKDPKLVGQVRENLLAVADGIVQARNSHGYARPLGTAYYWGCNGSVARHALILHAAHLAAPKKAYGDTALDALNHLFGRNVFGRSFVTGVGHLPPMKPHDRRSGGDRVDDPWPGYLVGGPHPKATDWFDDEGDYRTNEIAINWNGALIYALAAFLGGPWK